MADKPIWYEPHPCTKERQAELASKGYRIIDAIYAPAGWTPPDADDLTRDGIEDMDGPELTELLEAHGITDIPRKLADRRELLASVMFLGA